jgi:hypothetical protein
VLNMIEFCSGQLLDWFMSSGHVFPLIERLPTTITGNTSNPNCPGAPEVALDKAYTQIVKDIPVTPCASHNVLRRPRPVQPARCVPVPLWMHAAEREWPGSL